MRVYRLFYKCWLIASIAVTAIWMGGCGGADQKSLSIGPDPVARALEQGFQVDTLGVRDLAAADTVNGDAGLTIIETTITFRPPVSDSEVIGWEFYAEALHPVKLLLMRYDRAGKTFELVGESPTVVPRHLGVNRVALPEPIPVAYGTMYGIYQAEAGTIPFRKVLNWKTLITASAFQRPFTPRALFSMYGWRYAARVFYRYRSPTAATASEAATDTTLPVGEDQ